MATEPITPPVAQQVLSDAEQAIKNGSNVQADLTLLQKIVTADKSAIIAAIVHVAVLVVAAFKLHLSGSDVAILGSIVTAGLSWFLTVNLAQK